MLIIIYLTSERDTTIQVIGSIEEVISLVNELCNGLTWKEGASRLPLYTGVQEV